MKKLLNYLPFLMIALLFTSCEDDPIVDTFDPSLSLEAGPGLITGDATVAPDSILSLRITGAVGTAELNSLTFALDGVTIDPSRLTIDGTQPGSGALLLTGAGRNGFTANVTIRAQSDVSVKNFSITLTDTDNRSDAETITITTEKIPASLAFVEEAPFFWMDAMVASGSSFSVKLLADGGTTMINSLTVYADDQAIIADRVFYDNVVFPENPFVLAGDARTGFEWVVRVKAHVSGVKTYAFEIADVDGETQRVSLDISAGTLIDSNKVVLLLNAGGPSNTGGVNLITGASVGSMNAGAHLIDRGIDTDLPAATNWIRRIAPGANAEVRILGANPPEGFSFGSVTTKEQIQAAYDTGTMITESDVVNVDDIFLVFKNEKYILVIVRAVTETTNNNNDKYDLEVKF